MSNLTNLKKCQIILGNYYGDGSYQRNKKYQNASYLINKHSNTQIEYVRFLEILYRKLNIYQFSNYKNYNPSGYLDGNMCSYVACKPPIIDFFESIDFQKNNKKIITENGLLQLHEFGLFLWYLDDGSLGVYKNKQGSKRHARLCTHNFTYDEHLIMQSIFKYRWNINLKIYIQTHTTTQKKYPWLYFNCTEFKKFFDVMRPYLKVIPQEMKYKFDMKYDVQKLANLYNL
jgi:hypothetical protein